MPKAAIVQFTFRTTLIVTAPFWTVLVGIALDPLQTHTGTQT
jgi:hypothetical protein